MEATHNQEAKTSRLNHQTIKMVNRQKIKTVTRKQNFDLQDHNHTYLDVRPGIVGMLQQIQHSNNSKKPV
jgi:hypothetical protein